MEVWVTTLTSHFPAHESVVTVAPFRAWRGSLPYVAREPIRVVITRARNYSDSEPTRQTLILLSKF